MDLRQLNLRSITGLNCWQGCGAYVQRYCAPRDEPAEIVLFTVPSTLTYLFNHCLTQIKINISALQIQYGIRAFAKFKRPECTRLHLRYVPGGACTRRPTLNSIRQTDVDTLMIRTQSRVRVRVRVIYLNQTGIRHQILGGVGVRVMHSRSDVPTSNPTHSILNCFFP